jgi:predicted ArsR family transcriptional regulator
MSRVVPADAPGDDNDRSPSDRSAVIRILATIPEGATVALLRARLDISESGLRRALSELSAAGIITSRRQEPVGRGRPSLVYRLGHRGGDEAAVMRLLVELLGSGISLDEENIRAFGRDQGRMLVRETDWDPVQATMARLGFAPHDTSRSADLARNEKALRFESCPFRGAVASGGVWAVCTLHRGLMEGLAEGSGESLISFDARDPISAGCEAKVRADVDLGPPN